MSAGDIASAVAAVRARIVQACVRAGRAPDAVRLVVATKTVPPAGVLAAIRGGADTVGENVIQEMTAKQDALAGEPDASGTRWDFIGTLQRNKVKQVVGRVAMVHGVDSVRLAEAMSARASAAGLVQEVLIEVNVSGEATKHGFPVAGLPGAVTEIGDLSGVVVRGAMTVAPARDPEQARRCFASLAQIIREDWWPAGAGELSMGMSDDFELAIEEGATMVRVGSAIFGAHSGLGLGA